MERLEAKKINGRTYYYYSKWGWVDGRCRRLWQKYLGKLEDMARAVEGGGPQPLYADIFQWGLPSVLWMECCDSKVIEETDRLCPKREQGLSVGQYLAIAAVNRAISPRSKRCMWEWLSQTVLLRHIPQASKAVLSSQRFWDHMDKIDAGAALSIWKGILKGVVRSRDIDLSRVSYDGTNFYTFIATFNVRSSLAKRGKNKQGRSDLRQVSYALFCSADGHMPLYYDVYEGSRNDAKEFPLILKRFHGFLKELTEGADQSPATTLIFDKGNNSEENFRLIDSLNLSYVGSVKLDQHKDLAQISNKDTRFMPCLTTPIDGTKAFRVKKKVYGRERILVVTFNQNLFDTQWLTIHNDISKALEKLSTLRQRLEDRANGIIKGGKPPTKQSVENQCKDTLSRQYMKLLIKTTITQGSDGIPQLCYELDSDSLGELADTCLGKNIIITDREDWDDESIISAYRSQFIIEEVFKEMKDRQTGSWWPLHHWTDSKITVHGLYCSVALLLRALVFQRVRQAGIPLSMPRLLSELDDIREVVNIYPKKRGQTKNRTQTVLTHTSDLQNRIIEILGLRKDENAVLG
jgi:transposase